ncbi:NAD(P)H azoreductase [Mycobacteroides salmoniphilum]|nr:NAD(P)H azoreductase [Mycobacteroides salmoniphilum]
MSLTSAELSVMPGSLPGMTVLVTGATGNIGRKVVDHLVALGVGDIRALTTSPEKAALPDGVTPVLGYLGKPESLAGVFDGVERMYLAPLPSTAVDVLELARAAGVGHVVALAGDASWWAEQAAAVENSGVGWTQLGPGEFMENYAMWAEQINRTGAVHEPERHVAQSPIAMDDIARVAAVVLGSGDEHLGKRYPITGPEAVTRQQLVQTIADVAGVEARYVISSPEEAVRELRPTMGDRAQWYVETLTDPAFEQPANTLVAELTGYPGTTFAQWVADNVGLFR